MSTVRVSVIIPLSKLDVVEATLDLGAARLEPGRQLQVGAQRVRRLVGGKAGRIGGHLEDDATGLVEVDGVEVLAIEHRGDVQAGVHQSLAPPLLRRVVGKAPGDVMDRAHRDAAG